MKSLHHSYIKDILIIEPLILNHSLLLIYNCNDSHHTSPMSSSPTLNSGELKNTEDCTATTVDLTDYYISYC